MSVRVGGQAKPRRRSSRPVVVVYTEFEAEELDAALAKLHNDNYYADLEPQRSAALRRADSKLGQARTKVDPSLIRAPLHRLRLDGAPPVDHDG